MALTEQSDGQRTMVRELASQLIQQLEKQLHISDPSFPVLFIENVDPRISSLFLRWRHTQRQFFLARPNLLREIHNRLPVAAVVENVVLEYLCCLQDAKTLDAVDVIPDYFHLIAHTNIPKDKFRTTLAVKTFMLLMTQFINDHLCLNNVSCI